MKHARPDYNRIQDPAQLIGADEPVFLLRARDALAPEAVHHWAELARGRGADLEIVTLAHQQAEAMREWQARNGSKLPDLENRDEQVRRLQAEIEMWKRRAAKHGCNVDDGDPDCG